MQEQTGRFALLVTGEVTHLAIDDLRPIGLSFFHAIIACKGKLSHREHGDRLELFVGLRPDLGFEEVVTGLLNDIGHRHIRVRVIEGLTQRGHFLLDQPIVFVSFAFALGRFDQLIGKQRQNGLKDLLARGLCPQNSARLFDLTALLAAAMPGSCDQILLHLLPGNAFSLSGKRIQLGPEVLDDLD